MCRQPLLQRLRSYRGNDQDSILPTVLVRKYIAYAREFCTPVGGRRGWLLHISMCLNQAPCRSASL